MNATSRKDMAKTSGDRGWARLELKLVGRPHVYEGEWTVLMDLMLAGCHALHRLPEADGVATKQLYEEQAAKRGD